MDIEEELLLFFGFVVITILVILGIFAINDSKNNNNLKEECKCVCMYKDEK